MARVLACFWFDVEDYVTPESDDALKSLLDIFTERRARGTWKVVGEKYRVLRERGRADIVEALHSQDVGYHTDNHSRHPTISAYTRGLGWDAGVREFEARERPGFEELTAEFGPMSCYGQPGGAWAPQAFPVLGEWGIPMYLDEGRNVGLDHQSFWFQNILTAFNLQENCLRVSLRASDRPQALEQAKRAFDATADRLAAGDGGLISIYYHPCEFSTSEFWDGVNFGNGRLTPRAEWRGASLLPAGEPEARLALFGQYFDHALAHPGVEVVDAAELMAAYRPQLPAAEVPVAELSRLASAMGADLTWAPSSVGPLSPAELMTGLASALNAWQESGALPATVVLSSPLGPRSGMESRTGGEAPLSAIVGAAGEVLGAVRADGYLPASVAVGENRLDPATAFVAMAEALKRLMGGEVSKAGNGSIRFAAGRLALEANVGGDERGLWDWSIFPRGFSAPDLMDLTRLQAWTMKPAQLR